MRENNILDESLVIEDLAKIAENFTGAEIETLVKRAASYAMNCFDIDTLKNSEDSSKKKEKKNKNNEISYSKVTINHFKYAFEEVKPMFGSDKDKIESSILFGMINYGKRYSNIYGNLESYVNQLKNSSSANMMSILLHGDSGNGKTSVACSIALNSSYPFIKLISPSQLAKLSDQGKAQEIMQTFENAYKSPMSFIIIDNIERIIEYIKIGPRFSNLILQTLLVYINKPPPIKTHKLIIIGTTNIIERMDDLELCGVFNHKIRIPALNGDEIKTVISNHSDVLNTDISDKASEMFKEKGTYIPIKELLMTIDETIQQKGKNFQFSDFKEICDLKEMENDF